MALASQVEQVLMVCPDIPREDIERDLTVTGNAQETINRIFEGLFLVGCPSPLPELDERTSASLDGRPKTAVPCDETDEIGRESGALRDAEDQKSISKEDLSSLEALDRNKSRGPSHFDDDSDHEELPDVSINNCQPPLLRKPGSNGFYKGTTHLSSLRETSLSEHRSASSSVSTSVGFHSSHSSTCTSSRHFLTDEDHGSLSEDVSQAHETGCTEECIDLTQSPQSKHKEFCTDSPSIDAELTSSVVGLRRESPILPSSENSDLPNRSGISIPSSHVSYEIIAHEQISDSGWETSERSRSSSSERRKSDFLDDPLFEVGAAGGLDRLDRVSSESEIMDVDDEAFGRGSPMSISSSDDEEEDITLSLLHRIRSKQMKNHPAAGMHQSRKLAHHRQGDSESRVQTSSSYHQSCKLPSKDSVDLSNDRQKRATDVFRTRVPKSYHDISDEEDDSSPRTNFSSCPSLGADISEAHSRASGLEDVRGMPQSHQGNSLASLPPESSCDLMPAKKKPRRSPEEIAASKQQALERRVKKDQEKQEKLRLQQERKQLKQREAQVQKALREAHKAHRPEECMKYVTIVIDPPLLEDPWGAALLARLQELDCKTALESQHIPGSITWRRQVMEHNLGDDLQLNTLHQVIEECQALVHLPVASFVDMVHTFKQEQQGAYCTGQESLREHASNVQQVLPGKAITFIIQGIEKYFRLTKNAKQRNFRSAVLGSEPSSAAVKKRRKKLPIEDITTVVTRVDMEEALVDLQLHTGCNVRLFETPGEVAEAVAMFTKSVAETPFKRERDKATFSFHVDSEWAGGVKVSKEGRGLLRVWRQQLQQFRNVSPEVASCIIAAYPSPRLLLRAYAECDTIQEARKLLQDIVIRRGEGVLATSRRVGPELSRRVHTLMTSTEPNLAL